MRRSLLLAVAGVALLGCCAEALPARAELAASAAAAAAPARAAATSGEAAVRHVNWVRRRIWRRRPETPAQQKQSLDALRKSLMEKLQALNGGQSSLPLPPPLPDASPVTGDPGASAPDLAAAAAPPKPPLPPCAPTFAMANWQGTGNFNQRLIELRQAIAADSGAARSLTRLAEFYLAYGLDGEALDVTQEVQEASSQASSNGTNPASPPPPGDGTKPAAAPGPGLANGASPAIAPPPAAAASGSSAPAAQAATAPMATAQAANPQPFASPAPASPTAAQSPAAAATAPATAPAGSAQAATASAATAPAATAAAATAPAATAPATAAAATAQAAVAQAATAQAAKPQPSASQAPASLAAAQPSTATATASRQSVHDRALLDADLAHLLMGEPAGATSALLTNPATCTRPDMALWQALEAAATHDAAGFEAAATASLAPLRNLPEPMLEQAAYRIAAATNDKDVLMSLAAILRKAKDTSPDEVSARLLLDARVAELKGDTATQRDLLASAARNHGTIPGLVAEARLAELDSIQPGPDTGAEERLADIARVYRDDAIGQRAAAYLAQRRVRQGQFAAALAIADQSARSDGSPRLDSRGAAIVASVLRLLLVDPPVLGLPPPVERVALFLRYQGYATPGAKGDDIRLAAAQMLLAHDLPATALDVLRQLVDPAAATPAAQAALAMAEAKAGEPNAALALVQAAPPSDDMQRAAAEALARLGRPADAAQQLDGLHTIPDRLRRAALLGEAKDWNDAAAVYAALLQDVALTGTARQHVLERYGFALALAGDQPDARVTVPADGLAARVIAALPPPSLPVAANGPATVAAVRAALGRVQRIETLLPTAAATASQGS